MTPPPPVPPALRAPRRHRRPRRLALALALALPVVALGACSGDDTETRPASSGTSGSPSAAASAAPVSTTVRIDHVQGAFPRERRASLERAVGRVVDGWLDHAFVTSYPRRSFPHAFDGFSPGARRLAVAQADLMTNRDLGRRIDAVRPTVRTVSLDVLATQGAARGVTARVLLRFRTSGQVERVQQVFGRLYLVRDDQGAWQVFGFDVEQRRVVPGASSGREKNRKAGKKQAGTKQDGKKSAKGERR